MLGSAVAFLFVALVAGILAFEGVFVALAVLTVLCGGKTRPPVRRETVLPSASSRFPIALL